MKRLQSVTEIIYRKLEEKCYGIKKQEGYQHLYQVSILCKQLAFKRNLNPELAGIIGICHDYATYYTGTSFDHAARSAMLTQEILENMNCFSNTEILNIITAIKLHSNKHKIDDPYSELIKDADILALYLEEPNICIPKNKKERLDKVKKELL